MSPLRSPAQLVGIGFTRSRVVIVNECHDGPRRCARTRRVGLALLPAAHAAGARHLAMEALDPEFARRANRERALPPAEGYLGQPELRELMAAALGLGWDLLDYEADFERRPRRDGEEETLDEANWRDAQEAGNINRFLESSIPGTKLLIWCGASHQRKTPERWHAGGDWIRLGQRLVERGLEPFVLDQSVTVEYQPGRSPRGEELPALRAELEALGGTGGWLREEDPSPAWRADASADAFVLSLDNALE